MVGKRYSRRTDEGALGRAAVKTAILCFCVRLEEKAKKTPEPASKAAIKVASAVIAQEGGASLPSLFRLAEDSRTESPLGLLPATLIMR